MTPHLKFGGNANGKRMPLIINNNDRKWGTTLRLKESETDFFLSIFHYKTYFKSLSEYSITMRIIPSLCREITSKVRGTMRETGTFQPASTVTFGFLLMSFRRDKLAITCIPRAKEGRVWLGGVRTSCNIMEGSRSRHDIRRSGHEVAVDKSFFL